MPNFKDEAVDPILGAGSQGQDQQAQQAASSPQVQKVMREGKDYEVVLINLIHSKETRDDVIDMLKSNPDPYISIPQAILTINDMGVKAMKQGGMEISTGAQLVASQFLFDDIVELGKASSSFELGEADIPAIMEDTYQAYVEKGLGDKSIDPIQLQVEVQKAMTEEQVAGGLVMGQGKVPNQPSQQAMVQQQVDTSVHQATSQQRASIAKQDAKGKQQALQQQQAATQMTERKA